MNDYNRSLYKALIGLDDDNGARLYLDGDGDNTVVKVVVIGGLASFDNDGSRLTLDNDSDGQPSGQLMM